TRRCGRCSITCTVPRAGSPDSRASTSRSTASTTTGASTTSGWSEASAVELVLPLKERRMQAAIGRPGGDVLGDLGICRAVSGDHQHDVIHRNGPERPAFQQLLENVFRLALGNGDPVSQGLEHALRWRVMCLVVTGDIVRPQSFDPANADRFPRAFRVFRTMVGMQAMRLGDGELAVGIMPFAIAR